MKQRTITAYRVSLLFLMLLFAVIFMDRTSYAAFPGKGTGTKINPFVIETAEQLNEMRNASDAYYVLAHDITLTEPWQPIANFNGVLDGRGYVIRNLVISDTIATGGFIRQMSGTFSAIKNIGFEHVNVNSTKGSYGAVVGMLENGSTLENVYVTGKVNTPHPRAGGLAGQIFSSGTIRNVYSWADVTASTSFVGGIVGYVDGTRSMVSHAYVKGKISSSSGKGGLIGMLYNGSLQDSYWNTSITDATNGVGFGSGTYTDTSLGIDDIAMKSQASFVGWDFQNLWKMGSTGYPVFRKIVSSVHTDQADGIYRQGATIPIRLKFNDTVTVIGTPKIALNSGGEAFYSSGSGTDTLTFTYSVLEGQAANKLNYSSSNVLTVNGGAIYDSEGQPVNKILPDTTTGMSLGNRNIAIKAADPYVNRVTSSLPDGTYGLGQTIPILVKFNKSVSVTGTPRLKLITGKYADYTTGSGTDTLTFNYNIGLNENAYRLDYESTSSLELVGGSMKDASNNNAILQLPIPGSIESLSGTNFISVDTTADTQAIDAVIAAINLLPDKALVVKGDASAIQSARQQYEALTTAQQVYVSNLLKLTEVETALADLQNVHAMHSTVIATTGVGVADGSSAIEINVTLRNVKSEPMSGRQVVLTAGSGSSVITAVYDTTNIDGVAKFSVTNTIAQKVTYSAMDVTDQVTLHQTATVSFIYGTPPSILLQASTEELTYDPVTVSVSSVVYGQHNAISVKKWANGNQTVDYFANHGSILSEDSFIAPMNGIYTVYMKDEAENENVATIQISNIMSRSRNADLQDLLVSNVGLTPAFSSEIKEYTATVAVGVNTVTITPTAAEEHATITMNGQSVRSGQASSAISLLTGMNTITIVVTAQDGMTSESYSVIINRLREASPEPPQAREPVSNVKNQETPPNIRIFINGQSEGNLAYGTSQIAGGRTKTIVHLDSAQLAARFDQLDSRPEIVIPVISDTDSVTMELTGMMVKKLEHLRAIVELRTRLGSFQLPIEHFAVEEIAAKLGRDTSLVDVLIRIEIAKSSEHKLKIIERSADNSTFAVSAPPVDFTITASSKEKSLEVDRLGAYISRTLNIPANVDPSTITTAVVVNEDGTISHVPTKVMKREGSFIAIIHSLSNRTYALITNQVMYADMKHHWAKEAVNEMGSRFIVNGVKDQLFAPDTSITRAQFAAIMIWGLGLPESGAMHQFNDVQSTDWYYGAVGQAYDYDLITGYDDNTFRPEMTITREEAMVMVARAMKLVGLDTSVQHGDRIMTAFADRDQVSAWAEVGIAAVVQAGLATGGTNNSLEPARNMTRAETAIMIQRLLIKAGFIRGDA